MLVGAAAARADAPHVAFDVAPTVACRDVTPPEFAELHPDERLIEAPLAISSLLENGQESDLVEFLYVVDSPSQSMRVEDYLPKTTLATDVVGSIGVERHKDDSRTLGLNVAGDVSNHLKATATGNATHSRAEKTVYERMPPLELLSASGTMQRGAAAYFKLKPSPRTSLEGAKEFLLVLRVPATWRGDFIRVQCDALGRRRALVHQFDEQV
ncbi:MAG: hypothetical protein KDA41_10005, partial [Planctomycetales bacterium]|nr:hypothetical protein [Planctomycetales bacterium]